MPEYLAPGVYVEEVSFRAKTIEGVSTSTAGFVGPTRFGPVSGRPELITSRLDYERIYGSLDDLSFDGQVTTNFVAHAVRAFFEEGGKRLYVSRVFNFGEDGFDEDTAAHHGRARNDDPDTGVDGDAQPLALVARFPGAAGNARITFTVQVGGNVLNANPAGGGGPILQRLQSFDVVHVGIPLNRDGGATNDVAAVVRWNTDLGAAVPAGVNGLYVVRQDPITRVWTLIGANATVVTLVDLVAEQPILHIRPVTVIVEIERPLVDAQGLPGFGNPELLGEFGFDGRVTTGLASVFVPNPRTRREELTTPFAFDRVFDPDGELDQAINLARDLLGTTALGTLGQHPPAAATPEERRNLFDQRRVVYTLRGGDDGARPGEEHYEGIPTFTDFEGDLLRQPLNGLLAFEPVEDISIVAAPGYTAGFIDDADRVFAIQNTLINHCERMRYRIAVLDVPQSQLVSGALDFRNIRSSKYAAIYYPWVTVANPLGEGRLNLPPSGFVAGIFARNDVDHAVFKAPANEVVRLAIDFEQRLSKAQQEVLNPESVNCFRFFEGRGFLLWGARLMTDDLEWKYVNLRRYFAFLEHSIDRGTQWVVFENNGPLLWANVRRTVEDFLLNEWKSGGLLGTKPEEAFFVRCDRSTMTQNDLDNGRLICLIGVAPVRPAEFVIFRIGQFTANNPS